MATTTTWRPVIACHLLGHSACRAGPEMANFLYRHLCRDVRNVMSRGIGIPVFHHQWDTPDPNSAMEAIRRTMAETTVILPLVDDHMAGSDEWTALLETIDAAPERASGAFQLLPVALSDYSYNVSPKIGVINFLRLQDEPPETRAERLAAKLTHELCRLLLSELDPKTADRTSAPGEGPAPVQLFLSHAKLDGIEIVTELLHYLSTNSPVEAFFDVTKIRSGEDFRKEIEQGVARSALVIVHSDAYASREWCRREVLLAKKYQCPILVVIAVEKEEDRSFPYLGNVPTMRWDPADARRCPNVVDRALREMLRSAHFRCHIANLQARGIVPGEYQILTRPPEVLTYANMPRVGATADERYSPVIYPDPPLGDEELDLIHSMWPDARMTTPIGGTHSVRAKSATRPLEKTAVAISVSQTPDLPDLGIGDLQVVDAVQEFARHILSNGGTIVYGGDLRKEGFTEKLIELVQTYRLSGHQPWNRIRDYISWPIHLEPDSDQWATLRAQYKLDAVFRVVEKPPDVTVPDAGYFPPDTVERQYAWARGLTLMRERMHAEEDLKARVILGGRVTGFVGKYPGILEEALAALKAGKALFVCGGYGGCAREIAIALKGGSPEHLTQEFQEKDSAHAQLVDYYSRNSAERIDYASVRQYLALTGVVGLRNGLSDEENLRLFETPFLTEIIFLVLKGLGNLTAN